MMTGLASPQGAKASISTPTTANGRPARLGSIDALRGLVMVIMLLDHLRETWFLHVAVPDPIDANLAEPALYIARLAASLCAPIFILLTGISAFLYGSRHTLAETRMYLLKRGLVLMALEIFVLSPFYWGIASPTFWLQVIWCIGVCMIVLAALVGVDRRLLLATGLLIVAGHNLLDPIHLTPEHPLFAAWAMVHQRDVIELPFGLLAKTTYPVLPWIGVILTGYAIGPWFLGSITPEVRCRRLILAGVSMLALFGLLRLLNVYGDTPWFVVEGDTVRTLMSVFALTKYPPSLLFLLLTLGVGALLLAGFERLRSGWLLSALSVFGGAPMFFYLFHLAVLRILYHAAEAAFGPTQGAVFGISEYSWVLVWYVGLIVPLYLPTVWFSRFKAARRDIPWLKYL